VSNPRRLHLIASAVFMALSVVLAITSLIIHPDQIVPRVTALFIFFMLYLYVRLLFVSNLARQMCEKDREYLSEAHAPYSFPVDPCPFSNRLPSFNAMMLKFWIWPVHRMLMPFNPCKHKRVKEDGNFMVCVKCMTIIAHYGYHRDPLITNLSAN